MLGLLISILFVLLLLNNFTNKDEEGPWFVYVLLLIFVTLTTSDHVFVFGCPKVPYLL
jgi:hypothetical protein